MSATNKNHDALIKRIDEYLQTTAGALAARDILKDCRAALSRKYVPMDKDELLAAWDKTEGNDWLHESLGIFEAEIILRAGLEVQE